MAHNPFSGELRNFTCKIPSFSNAFSLGLTVNASGHPLPQRQRYQAQHQEMATMAQAMPGGQGMGPVMVLSEYLLCHLAAAAVAAATSYWVWPKISNAWRDCGRSEAGGAHCRGPVWPGPLSNEDLDLDEEKGAVVLCRFWLGPRLRIWRQHKCRDGPEPRRRMAVHQLGIGGPRHRFFD